MKDITLGQYFPGESMIHQLDPRTKIIGTLAFLISLFLVKNFIGFAIASACLASLIFASGVPFKFMLRGLRPILFLIIFTMLINLFMTTGTVWLNFGPLSITHEGVYRATFMAFRLVLLIFGSSLLTLVTKPITLTDGMERLLSPMNSFGVPSHELAMMMTIALRFIPTLLEETDKIMKAQTARGADFESGNIIKRAKGLIPLLVPLFISAFRIAADLAMAMESRCYRGGRGRTRMNGMTLQKKDAFAGFVLFLYMFSIVYSRNIV
ncbi:MAG: energy-coupling factor transporter transmembrane protein EcfT [Clostridia bacterium]|nr:energy-coupling factor transporter transmembrane protein EcfT [Clostridia bacterium]